MPMFQGFADRLSVRWPWPSRNRLPKDIDRLVGQLFEAAIALWGQDRWMAYNEEEENCTVQLLPMVSHR